MLNRKHIVRAVDLQQRSYRLLRWMAEAVANGFISFDTAHEYSSLPDAAEDWISDHYENIPPSARPERHELSEFCSFFATYLENSFVLIRGPGRRLYSPDFHCFCFMCSWLIDAPNLKTKKPTSADKRRARKMRVAAVRRLAAEYNLTLADESIDVIVDDPNLSEATSLLAYAYDLLGRMKGNAVGPAVLVLWRGFAWTREGSPRKKFELSADLILERERQLCEVIQSYASKSG